MAGTQIQLEVDDLERVLAAFDRAAEAPADRTLWADIGEALQLSHRHRFEMEIAPDGTPWVGLDAEYQARKKRRQTDILVLDTYLRDQMSYEASAGGVDFGSSRIYAATHHYGDPDRGIPERPIIGVSDDDESHILRAAREHMEAAIGPGA